MTDSELIRAAIDAATDGNQTAFARLLGHADGSTVRAWLAGRVALTQTMRLVLHVIVAHPRTLRRWLTDAAE